MNVTSILDDVCMKIVDCEHKTAPIDESGEYFAVGTPAMRDGIIDFSQARRVSRATYEQWTRRLTPASGDLLLAREAPVGPIVRIPPEGNVAPGQRTVLLRPDPARVDSTFLYYLLGSPMQQRRLQERAAGSTVAHLNVTDVREFELPALPDLDGQRAIADVLGTLDDKIAANRKVAETANELAALMLRECEHAPLIDLVEHRRSSQMPSTSGAARVAHFSLPAFDECESPEIVDPMEIKSSKFRVEAPSVLISKLNPRFPRIWEIPTVPDIPAYSSTEFLVLEPKYGSTSTLWAALRQPAVTRQLESMVAGTSGSHQRVKPADLLGVNVPDVRSIDDRTRSAIEGLSGVIHSARRESQNMTTLRDALLPRLMSGELRVRDAEKSLEQVL
ncbi:restriction endonuclease subunit S [Rhodococcus zopfii]|uniref:restriction endonuclease subunit S n=1 Tax=Rhodococcus zopfii TaxID=43772 RepID=UPI00111144D0|nr:restriction endonuclease subunit S [Rhodococcus zopfii]